MLYPVELRALSIGKLASADSGLQLDLGDRAKRCLSERPAPCGLFSRAEDKVKLSDDVIEEVLR